MAHSPKQPVLTTRASCSMPWAFSSRSKASMILGLLEEEQPVPVQTRIWERTKFICNSSPYSAAPMVYSATGLWLTRCSETMRGTISGVSFT